MRNCLILRKMRKKRQKKTSEFMLDTLNFYAIISLYVCKRHIEKPNQSS